MPKKLLALLLALSLLVSLYACGTSGSETSRWEISRGEASFWEASQESSEPFEDSSSDNTESGWEIPLPEDFFSRNGQTELPAHANIPSYAQATAAPYLYELPFSGAQDGESPAVVMNEKALALYFWEDAFGGYCLRLYDLQTGALRTETAPDVWCAVGLLDDGRAWTMQDDLARICAYDESGEQVLYEGTADGLYRYSFHVTGDGRYAVAMRYEDRCMADIIDLQSGQLSTVSLSGTGYFYVQEAYGHDLLLSSVSPNLLLRLNLDTGTYSTQPMASSVNAVYGGLYYMGDSEYFRLQSAEEDECLFGSLKKRMGIGWSGLETVLTVGFGCMVAETSGYGGDGGVAIYDLREGKLKIQDPLSPLGSPYVTGAWFFADGTLLLCAQDGMQSRFFLYDLPSAMARTTLSEPIETVVGNEQTLLDETDRIAGELYEQTGVELLYGSRGNDFVFFDYLGHVEPDAFVSYLAVRETVEFLSLYPDGMLRECYESIESSFRIYLCSTLYGVSEYGLNFAAGLTATVDGRIEVVIDISCGVAQTLRHEMSHVFDRRIAQAGAEAGVDWIAAWKALTPYADAYVDSYTSYENLTAYVVGFDSASRVWFVRNYGRVSETEDRATLMELMLRLPGEAACSEFTDYPHLAEKAQAYAYILRQCFPSCRDAKTLPWEFLEPAYDGSLLQIVM